jgi:hypothetical protein
MCRYRYLRRTDLFLVRVWRDVTRDQNDDDGSGTGGGKTEWRGKVQRVVDGESHQFDNWQGLVDSLLVMLSENEGR